MDFQTRIWTENILRNNISSNRVFTVNICIEFTLYKRYKEKQNAIHGPHTVKSTWNGWCPDGLRLTYVQSFSKEKKYQEFVPRIFIKLQLASS